MRESREQLIDSQDAKVTATFGRAKSFPARFLGRLLGIGPSQIPTAAVKPSRDLKKTWSPPSGYFISFFLGVIVPSLATIAYLAFIASDQYVAETKFAVRSIQSESSNVDLISSLSSMASGGGKMAMSNQDAYIVTGYIHSRAIIDDLSKTMNLREIFMRPGSDFWARLRSDATIEQLTEYWNDMVGTYVDAQSGIVTVVAKAFRSEDALALSDAITHASEKLVNEVSARARDDAMRRAELEVRLYEGRVRDALLDLQKFRDKEGFIDPGSAATSTSKLLLGAISDKIRLQNELYVSTRAMSETAPTVQTLKMRLESLDGQINQLRAQLTGNSLEKTISNSLVKFEELELKRIFAEKMYTMSQNALERARVRAEQQNIYISVFVPPSLPESAEFPRRISLSFVIPITLGMIWGIFSMVAAAVKDHRL